MTATIDTSGWIHHDNLRSLDTSALNTFATNNINNYTLIESEPRTFVSSRYVGLGNSNGTLQVGGDYRIDELTYRYDCAQIPFLRSTVPTFGETDLFSYNTLSHGRGVRPYQGMTWTGPQGQHIHCMPTIDSIQVKERTVSRFSEVQSRFIHGNPIFAFRFFYSSLTNNYAFPNFNAAAPEFDIWVFEANNVENRYNILDWPITTTGAGSNIVFSTTAPSGSVMRRSGIGTGEMEVHGVNHIPSSSQIEGNPSLTSGRLIIAVRLHSQTAPYVRDNVPRITNPAQILLQQGPYGSGENFTEDVNDTLHLGGSVVVDLVEYENRSYVVTIGDSVRLTSMVETTFEDGIVNEAVIDDSIHLGGQIVIEHIDSSGTRHHNVIAFDTIRLESGLATDLARMHAVHPLGGIRLLGEVEEGDTGYSVRINDAIHPLSELTYLFGNAILTDAVYGNIQLYTSSIEIHSTGTVNEEELPNESGGGGSYLLTAGRRLWKSLGLPV